MQNFIFHPSTKVFFGQSVEMQIGREIRDRGFHRVLLHYGGGNVLKTGVLDRIKESLQSADLEWVELGGVEPNPKLSLVRKGMTICIEQSVDFILAVGGGSVIDSAKAIGIGLANGMDPWDMIIRKVTPKKSFPIGAVPTIAAAGSETSPSLVITNTDGWLKRSINSDCNRPLFAMLNPEITYSVSPYQTACGIVDIMMHTLERYVSPSDGVDLTDRIGEGLLLAVKDAGNAVIKNPLDYEARSTLQWASSLSHNGLTGCGKTVNMIAHKIEHEISGLFDQIPHGAGMAVIYPAWLKFIYPYDSKRLSTLAVKVWGVAVEHKDPEKTAIAGIEAMQQYFQSIGMPTTLGELGIDADSFQEIADKCTEHGTVQFSSFRVVGKEEVLEILRLAK